MSITRRRSALLLTLTLAVMALAAPVATAEQDEWQSLFNGKDLAGWTCIARNPDAKMQDTWSVQDGTIVCTGKPLGYIRTEKDYTNYVLKFEWRFNPERGPGNSGVLLRLVGQDKIWPKSIEAQLQSEHAGDIWNIDQFPMTVDPERTKGRRTLKVHPTNEKPLGEWNTYEITLDQGKLELKVNGLVQNTATDCEVVPGKIGLQSEGAEIHFRKIEIKELK